MAARVEFSTYSNPIKLNVNRIIEKTAAEGPGMRLCIWLQGCIRHCPGCFARDTWSFEEREMHTPQEVINMAGEDVEGITILGGEPLEQMEGLLELVRLAKDKALSVILFTGYKYEEVKQTKPDLLKYIDVLIDGEYVQEKRSFERPLVGSANQNFIFLTDKYNMKSFSQNRIEVRIGKDGKTVLNGMGDFEILREKMGKNNEI